jgi:photosystem II stability/assembly factor-like uncharacterized protein
MYTRIVCNSGRVGALVLCLGLAIAGLARGQDSPALRLNPVLRSVSFVTTRTGWAAGSAGIYQTTDGGRSWKKLGDLNAGEGNLGGEVPANAVWSMNTRTGKVLVARKDMASFLDQDGTVVVNGSQVTRTAVTKDSPGYRGLVWFENPHSGWSVARVALYRTVDGGRSWTVARLAGKRETFDWGTSYPSGPLLLFSKRSVRLAKGEGIGVSVNVLRSEDGGRTWTRHRFPAGWHEPVLGHFVSGSSGRIACISGRGITIFGTSDGGASWARLGDVDRTVPYGMSFVNEKEGWMWGLGEGLKGIVLLTRDGGITWKSTGPPSTSVVLDLSLLGPGTAWAVGGKGEIAHTSDFGRTWDVGKIP